MADTKAEMERTQQANERAKDPTAYDKKKQMYDSATKQDKEKWNPVDAIKELVGVEKKKAGGCVKMAKGGSASSRADGCAQRGKTRGKMV